MSDKVENQPQFLSAEDFMQERFDADDDSGWRLYDKLDPKKEPLEEEEIAQAYGNYVMEFMRASSRAPEGAALRAIAELGGNLRDETLTSRTGPNDARARGLMYVEARRLANEALADVAAHSEGVDTKELAELRAIVGRCEKTSPSVLGGRCDRPKGHRGSHETRNRMTTWLGPNDEPELSEGVDGWVSVDARLPEPGPNNPNFTYPKKYFLLRDNGQISWETMWLDVKQTDLGITHWLDWQTPAPPKESTR